ncbi:MAG: hypothetical protein KDB88_02015 [Flavobacteriales bacterium]|nr:hypothetical protein [Flavobacteriales bacterium]
MAKALFTLLLVFSAVLTCIGQDIMYLMNGDTMSVKVTEVSETEVRYKQLTNLNGPAYVIARTKVYMVVYENGSKDVFASQSNETVAPIPENDRSAIRSKREELEKVYRRKLGGGIAGVIVGSLGTIVCGSAFAVALNESSSDDETRKVIPWGMGTVFGLTLLGAGIGGIISSGAIRRELNALPVVITPVILDNRSFAEGQPNSHSSFGLTLAYTF